MFKRKLIWSLVICIAIVVIFSGIDSYFYERHQLKRYLADNDFHAYEYHKTDDATLALFTNKDGTMLGLAEMSVDGYGYGTIETLDVDPFDYIYSSDESNHYLGIRLNKQPQNVAYLRIIGDRIQEQHILNRTEDSDYADTHIIELRNRPTSDWILQTLDQNEQVLDSIDL
ncbi:MULTISPECIES: hypothetical protein [unclassified Exiguobacterium]|uniref:hypothetical protein n=1 Tax=unclassified Exiguobacterium TaxID=2644629 RepID=UPI00103E0F56|nr:MULTISPECIES: hypothetical protein [unclassified Exiguobacterium]TCI48471.1 hypothetical protein EVJ31_05425 [Exiguobacterium sp. SH5S32]TCI55358.1 hypothetical protein EVJ25_05415 [Exiguobacterium sp. SH1S4]TCI75152.1 hypothetical protein EVJ23_05415 [Exiguobacterium sp. SH1S1]